MDTKLQQAIEESINRFGEHILVEERFVNILSDYHAFENNVSYKDIVLCLIHDGYTQKIIKRNLWGKHTCNGSEIYKIATSVSMVHGYKMEDVIEVISLFAISLGIDMNSNSQDINNSNLSNNKLVDCNITLINPLQIAGIYVFLFVFIFIFYGAYIELDVSMGVCCTLGIVASFLVIGNVQKNHFPQRRQVIYQHDIPARLKKEKILSCTLALIPVLFFLTFLFPFWASMESFVNLINDTTGLAITCYEGGLWAYLMGILGMIIWGWVFYLHSPFCKETNYFGKKLINTENTSTQFVIIRTLPEEVTINLGYGPIIIKDGTWTEELPVGDYTVLITPHSTDYKEVVEKFNLNLDQKTELEFILPETNPSYPVIIKTNGREITIDGSEIIPIVGGMHKCSLKAGYHTIEIFAKGCHKSVEDIRVLDIQKLGSFNLPKLQSFELSKGDAIYGRAKIISLTQGLSVAIDGKNVGTTPIVLNRLAIGTHAVEIKTKDQIIKTSVEIEGDKLTIVDVDAIK